MKGEGGGLDLRVATLLGTWYFGGPFVSVLGVFLCTSVSQRSSFEFQCTPGEERMKASYTDRGFFRCCKLKQVKRPFNLESVRKFSDANTLTPVLSAVEIRFPACILFYARGSLAGTAVNGNAGQECSR